MSNNKKEVIIQYEKHYKEKIKYYCEEIDKLYLELEYLDNSYLECISTHVNRNQASGNDILEIRDKITEVSNTINRYVEHIKTERRGMTKIYNIYGYTPNDNNYNEYYINNKYNMRVNEYDNDEYDNNYYENDNNNEK